MKLTYLVEHLEAALIAGPHETLAYLRNKCRRLGAV